MARTCEICGKGPLVGYTVSHSNNKTKKRSYPNLKRIKANLNGTVRTINACTKCIKASKVVRAI